MCGWSPVPEKLILAEICDCLRQVSVQSSQNTNQKGDKVSKSELCYLDLCLGAPCLPSIAVGPLLPAASANPVASCEDTELL